MTRYLPIIYVRGFAGGTSGIDKAVDDPFYGFNEGSTHVRIGAYGIPSFLQFESPLLRLMIDHKYDLMVGGNQGALLRDAGKDQLSPKTIWVYRFYDRSASTFDRNARTLERSGAVREETPGPFRLEDAAQGLVHYIYEVLEKTKDAEQVYLVAHSMGGLVCRSAIQRFMYDAQRTPPPEQIEEGEGSVPDPAEEDGAFARFLPGLFGRAPRRHRVAAPSPSTAAQSPSGKVPPEFPVSKVVTYGTPHGGIEIELGGPIGDWVIETFGPEGSDIFKERRMREYLCPDGQEKFEPKNGWDARVPYFSALPAERFLSLVGTNPGDYDAGWGWSSRAVGVKSDGLVQIRNAYLKGSNRAYIHRSHSGRYGLVNSEEGYQNLQRFLFGNLKIALSLSSLDLDTSGGTVWQADVALAIRELPVLMHYQSARTHCPVVLNEENKDTPLSPVPLVTTFLLPSRESGTPRRYTLDLRVFALRENDGLILFGSHLEQVADWQDTLIMDVYSKPDGTIDKALYQWNSTLPGAIARANVLDKELDWKAASDSLPEAPSWVAKIALPDLALTVLGPEAHISVGIVEWP
ncbi:UNVERIFIED_ORG: hypothetical protein J2X79_004292 [Arthrobacter globiformis]|nr:hypothetical protein [Arthrobacter globiformis]